MFNDGCSRSSHFFLLSPTRDVRQNCLSQLYNEVLFLSTQLVLNDYELTLYYYLAYYAVKTYTYAIRSHVKFDQFIQLIYICKCKCSKIIKKMYSS